MIFLFDDANEPKDIFAEIPSEKPVARQPVPPMPRPGLPAEASAQDGVVIERTPFSKKWIIIPLVIVLLGGLGYGGWYLFFRGAKTPVAPVLTPEPTPTPEPQPEPTPAPPAPTIEAATTTESATAPTQEITPPPAAPALDSDGDGLTDQQEVDTYRTNPNDPDTDHDGLTDREEVIVYLTNPDNSDTDGDTYSDGAEVKAGYNPNGPGKLLQLP